MAAPPDSGRLTPALDLVHFQIHYMTMIQLNIHEAKTHLSKYLERVLAGETIILCRRNRPIAEIRPLPPARRDERPVGLARGEFEVSDEFFDDLPPDVLESFEGGETTA